MKIFIQSDMEQQRELATIDLPENETIFFSREFPKDDELKNFDAFLILATRHFSIEFSSFENKAVLINEVIHTLPALKLPPNVSRINGWTGFLKREVWEVASENSEKISPVLNALNRRPVFVKDLPGLVSARIISRIINEAFFALGEKVSTKEEIDLAMKLGTNYPFGPFEWVEQIGVENIFSLLIKLSEEEKEKYEPAPALKKLFLEKSGKLSE